MTSERQQTETETFYLLPVTQDDLIQARVEFNAEPEMAVAIRYGVSAEDGDATFPWFFEIVRQESDGDWHYALPHFGQRYTAMYKGRIDKAHNENLIRQILDQQVPDWRDRLVQDQALLEEAFKEI